MQVVEASRWAYSKLKEGLTDNHTYHNLKHTLYVAEMANKIAIKEGCSAKELELLFTACMFHDVGFLELYPKNEYIGARIAGEVLPDFGYSKEDIEIIRKMILATKIPQQTNSLLDEIICDSDLYYLGTELNYEYADNLRMELAWQKMEMTDIEWLEFQIGFLKMHKYFTKTANNDLNKTKEKYKEELIEKLEELKNNAG